MVKGRSNRGADPHSGWLPVCWRTPALPPHTLDVKVSQMGDRLTRIDGKMVLTSTFEPLVPFVTFRWQQTHKSISRL